jgi:hypothetical protein
MEEAMQRLTLIAAGLIGALSLSAAASAHGWDHDGGWDRDDAPRAARYEHRDWDGRYGRLEALRIREAEARREAAPRCERVAYQPAPVRYAYPAPSQVVLAPRLPFPGGAITLPGLVLNFR